MTNEDPSDWDDVPRGWDDLKQKRAEIDEYACTECGRDDVLFVVSTDGTFGLSDLETRCYDHAPTGWTVEDALVE